MAGLEFLIVSFANDERQYAEMRSSFEAAGFSAPIAEFLMMDNCAANVHDPYRTIPQIVARAGAEYVLFVHQDVLANQGDRIDELRAQISSITAHDPDWAVLANVGVDADLLPHAHYSDSTVSDMWLGSLPSRVCSVDEHFFVIRQSAGAITSAALDGFHLYATDICLHALQAGRTCWAIDFHLQHLGGSLQSADMIPHLSRFAKVWNNEVDFRFLRTPCFAVLLSRSPFWSSIFGHPSIALLMMRRPRLYRWLKSLLRPLGVVRKSWIEMGAERD